MHINVGISNNDLSERRLNQIVIASTDQLSLVPCQIQDISLLNNQSLKVNAPGIKRFNDSYVEVNPQRKLTFSASGNSLLLDGKPLGAEIICLHKAKPNYTPNDNNALIIKDAKNSEHYITNQAHQASLRFENIFRAQGKDKRQATYNGLAFIRAKDGKLIVWISCPIDHYLSGVLVSEIPGNYPLEAIKAQAVAARTYALHPRIDHSAEGFQTCDSYLCCQNYLSDAFPFSPPHVKAIEATRGQILTYQGKPILALFSACAGGHTENYADCFSDPKTNAFPPAPLPYLKGISEFTNGKSEILNTDKLRQLYNNKYPATYDAASPHFRWKQVFTSNQIEAHMHHVIDEMSKNPEMKPFIIPSESGKFGHIKQFDVIKRGVGGTAIEMAIYTSQGMWKIKKELVIRSVFANPEVNVKRLKSARMYFDHEFNNIGLLQQLTIYGLGWGHGVGMQQDGAKGMALSGKTYKQILEHYYQDCMLETK